MTDLTEFARQIGASLKKHVADALMPLADRIKALEERAPLRGEKGERGEPGANGQDGINGKDGTDGHDGQRGENGADGIDGKDGQDGVNGVDGKSITLDDVLPTLKSMQAEWALDFERRAQALFQKSIDAMPKPKDGIDGLGFDDLSVDFDGERSVTLKFQRGEQVKTFDLVLPTVIDRGVFRPETEYSKGDGVTFGGSFWIAQKSEAGKPGEGSDGWRLAVKRGRDGKDYPK